MSSFFILFSIYLFQLAYLDAQCTITWTSPTLKIHKGQGTVSIMSGQEIPGWNGCELGTVTPMNKDGKIAVITVVCKTHTIKDVYLKADCTDETIKDIPQNKFLGISAHQSYFDKMVDDYYYDAEVEAAREERALRKLRRERSRIKQRRNHYN